MPPSLRLLQLDDQGQAFLVVIDRRAARRLQPFADIEFFDLILGPRAQSRSRESR
jgi:hypothetical protein